MTWVGAGRAKHDYLKLVLYFSCLYSVRHFKTFSLKSLIHILYCWFNSSHLSSGSCCSGSSSRCSGLSSCCSGSGSSFSERVDMGGKEAGSSGARIWVGWSCSIDVWERGKEGTGCVEVEGWVGWCNWIGNRGVDRLHWHIHCTRGATVGVDARISSPF